LHTLGAHRPFNVLQKGSEIVFRQILYLLVSAARHNVGAVLARRCGSDEFDEFLPRQIGKIAKDGSDSLRHAHALLFRCICKSSAICFARSPFDARDESINVDALSFETAPNIRCRFAGVIEQESV
jgi:hypothetical protein